MVSSTDELRRIDTGEEPRADYFNWEFSVCDYETEEDLDHGKETFYM